VIVPCVEQGGDDRRSSLPGGLLRKAHPNDGLIGPYSQCLAMDVKPVMPLDDGKSIQDSHETVSKSSNSNKECSISSGSCE
jgi:hypothetical protein